MNKLSLLKSSLVGMIVAVLFLAALLVPTLKMRILPEYPIWMDSGFSAAIEDTSDVYDIYGAVINKIVEIRGPRNVRPVVCIVRSSIKGVDLLNTAYTMSWLSPAPFISYSQNNQAGGSFPVASVKQRVDTTAISLVSLPDTAYRRIFAHNWHDCWEILFQPYHDNYVYQLCRFSHPGFGPGNQTALVTVITTEDKIGGRFSGDAYKLSKDGGQWRIKQIVGICNKNAPHPR